MGVKATIQSASSQPPASTLPGGKLAGKTALPAPQAQVHFTLPVAPFSVNWNAIPGFRITRVAMRADGWNVEGVLYGR
jgi:hypothetical protein